MKEVSTEGSDGKGLHTHLYVFILPLRPRPLLRLDTSFSFSIACHVYFGRIAMRGVYYTVLNAFLNQYLALFFLRAWKMHQCSQKKQMKGMANYEKQEAACPIPISLYNRTVRHEKSCI